jgi:hypothetical protein
MSVSPGTDVALCDEFARACEQFRSLLDRDNINALQPPGPAAIYTPYVVVWLLVYQRLNANASLRDAVAELLQSTSGLSQQRRVVEQTLSSNSGAYSRARSRLEPLVAEHVADYVYQTLIAATPPSWGDRRALILDGTTLTLAPTPELKEAFPPARNQHGASAWPVCLLVTAHELASGCAIRPEIGAMYGDDAVGELDLAERLLRRLPEKALLLADRNFGVFAFCRAAVAAGHDVVARLTESRFRSLQRKASARGPGTWTLNWKPTRYDRQSHPELPADASVSVRLHEVRVNDQLTLWLVTTLSDSGAALAELYRLRQDVETDIRDVKIALKLEEVRSKSAAMLSKELALSMVAYNLVVQVRRLAARKAGVQPRRLSFTGVWTLVKVILLAHQERTPQQWLAKFELVLRAATQQKLPNRPGRSYPRQVIPRRRKHPERSRQPPEQQK